FVRQELAETLYHVLWELVHVFFEHLQSSTAGAGASSFLYPFLDERDGGGLEEVVADVRRSVLMKADEVGALREQTLGESRAEARRRGLVTVAFVGYDGGRVAAERLADHVVVTRSDHIPRIQEAQASAYHVLRELVERSDGT